jgi:UDP-N-acetylglucosamine transferase subunit ALG13
MPAVTGPRIVVLVGTDHHPFDRLVGWINDWLEQHPAVIESAFIQSGTASLQPRCAGSELLDVGKLDQLLDDADVIICHGGPASIADAWRRGQIPIVVPRLRRLGEHVDDHQVDFCLKFAELGRVRLAQEAAVLAELLAEAMADLAGFRTSGPQPAVDAAVARFGALVDELISGPRRRVPLIHRVRRPRGGPTAGADIPADTGVLPPGLRPAARNEELPYRVPVSANIDSFAQKGERE